MNGETLNFVVGWLAGLIPSLITVYIGYRFQMKSEERRRKAEVIYRRLDQMETITDSYMDSIREIDDFVESFLKDGKSQNISTLRDKVKKLAYTSNVFTILNDQELNSLVEELKSVLVSQNELLLELVRTKGRDQESPRAKQMELSRSITELNAKIKRRIDSIRSLDPIKYYKG